MDINTNTAEYTSIAIAADRLSKESDGKESIYGYWGRNGERGGSPGGGPTIDIDGVLDEEDVASDALLFEPSGDVICIDG